MKIAYLFIAHNHPELLAKTIGKLHSENAWFYIHVDKKSDQSLFEEQLSSIGARIKFVEERKSIFWMGYSMVAAGLELMKLARRSLVLGNSDVDYFILLSGVDYPIKSNQEIEEALLESGSKNFLMYWKLHDLPQWLYKVHDYHYLDSRWHNQRAAPVFFGKMRMPFYRIERVRHWVHRLLPKRKLPLGLVPYGGSQWWMLTTAAVEYILDFLEKAPEVGRFFRFTHSPDELMIQTILMNSRFKDSVHGKEDYDAFIDAWKNNGDPDFVTDCARNFNLRYIDWDPVREFPSILDERDYPAIQKSSCLFARKFDPIRSEMLIDILQKDRKIAPTTL